MLIIDRNGKAGFDEWFDKEDAEKVVNALNSVGFEITTLTVDWELKPEPALEKRKSDVPIPLTPENIVKILTNRDKTNREVLEILGFGERESDFIITTKSHNLTTDYEKWKKLDHPQEWENEAERIRAFANYFDTSKKYSTNNKVIKAISSMEREGCLQLADEKFPECKDKFNTNCLTCQFNKGFIKNDADIDRFNQVLKEEYEDDEDGKD